MKSEENKLYKKAYVGWKAIESIERRILKSGRGLSRPERVFDKITPDIVKFTGNKGFKIKTKNKIRWPDFKIKGQNKVIEIFGIYYHDLFRIKNGKKTDNPKDLIKEYKEVGIDCLIFWEYEIIETYEKRKEYPKPDLERVLKRTLEFIKM